MKTLIATLLMLCALPLMAATSEPCAIRHCPAGTSCRPAPTPCPPCPTLASSPCAQGGQDEPVPVPPAPKVEIRYVPVAVKVPVPGPERVTLVPTDVARGRFMLPLSVFKLNDVKGIGAGLGYQFRNRMVLSGQVLLADNDRVSTLTRTSVRTTVTDSDGDGETPLPRHCGDGHGQDGSHNPHCQGGGDPNDPPPVVTRRSTSSTSRNNNRDTGVMLTLTIPLGR